MIIILYTCYSRRVRTKSMQSIGRNWQLLYCKNVYLISMQEILGIKIAYEENDNVFTLQNAD